MKLDSKYNKLYNCSNAFFMIGFIIIFTFLINIWVNSESKPSDTVSKSAPGFNIENYKIFLDVGENNSIDVEEYITVNFYEKGHHGIYRFIPEWLEYTSKDNNTISRRAKIKNLVSCSDDYSTSTVSGKKQIKMGNEDITLPIGTHTYVISYTYDMGVDPYDNFDEFIFHAFGDYWGTTINNASVEIKLPKNVNINNNIHFFADKYRKKDVTSYVDYTVSDNTIYAKLSSDYSLTNSLTIDLELPNEYFSNKTINYGSLSLLLCVICIIFAIVSFLLWRKNGKNLDKVPETVEFYPPEQLDASQLGYLYKYDTGRKLSIALIVELASKGFIKIIESKDKKEQTIVKNYTDINKAINREIKIIKMRDYESSSNRHSKNLKLMKDYFKEKNEYTITEGFDDFYKNADYLIKNKYIKVKHDSIDEYTKEDLEKLKQSLVESELKNKPKMTQNEELVYNQLFNDSEETVLSKNHSFYEVFSKVSENVRNEFDDKINDLKASKCMLISSLGFLICSFLLGAAYCIIDDLDTRLNFMYLLGATSIVVILVFSILMKRKTFYGEQIKSKINGFRNYIELAEKNQINMLAEENPNYFYDILPYAYVLGVSRKWIEKFENIPVPTNDMGNFSYCDSGSLDNLCSSVYEPRGDQNGSSYSSSGGCSSCGGGGSW